MLRRVILGVATVIVILVALQLFLSPLESPAVRVAVASNFAAAANEIAAAFEHETGVRVEIIPGSTGKHYAQIVAGAPYDIFLAADTLRPNRLDTRGIGVAGSRRVYARGRLAAWSADRSLDAEAFIRIVRDESSRIALANPDLAPYGMAARDVLERLGATGTRVFGENVAQASQFVATGSVEVGLVSLSVAGESPGAWSVPDSLHAPILQAAILLSAEPQAAAFFEFLSAPTAMSIIRSAGYETP